MPDDRYLPRAPSLRPAPRKRLDRRLARELPEAKWRPATPADAVAPNSIIDDLPLIDLPAPPARGPWEPKED